MIIHKSKNGDVIDIEGIVLKPGDNPDFDKCLHKIIANEERSSSNDKTEIRAAG